jgi:hypothetical protein
LLFVVLLALLAKESMLPLKVLLARSWHKSTCPSPGGCARVLLLALLAKESMLPWKCCLLAPNISTYPYSGGNSCTSPRIKYTSYLLIAILVCFSSLCWRKSPGLLVCEIYYSPPLCPSLLVAHLQEVQIMRFKSAL